jgi:glutathione S-transferase
MVGLHGQNILPCFGKTLFGSLSYLHSPLAALVFVQLKTQENIMKLYQNAMSPPCRRVLATVYHLDLQIELQAIDFKSGELATPAFTKMNPNGSVPLLEDGSFYLWESTAIMQYLAEKKGNNELYPQDARARADIQRWTAWSMCHFGTATGTFVYENLFKKMFGIGEPDPAALKAGEENFHKYAKVLEQQLTGNNFVTGKNVTLADFTLASNLMYAEGGLIPLTNYPNIQAWYKRIDALDAWKKSAPKF